MSADSALRGKSLDRRTCVRIEHVFEWRASPSFRDSSCGLPCASGRGSRSSLPRSPPEPGEEPLVGPVTAAAEAAGVRPGMPGEALATCPSLVLVDRDPATVERSGRAPCGASRTRASPSTPSSRASSSSTTKGVERFPRRRPAGAHPRARRGRLGVGTRVSGPPRRHRSRRGDRGPTWSDPDRRGEGGGVVPRAAPALVAPTALTATPSSRGLGPPARRLRTASQGAVVEVSGVEGAARGGGSPAAAARPRSAGGSRRSSSPRRSRSRRRWRTS